MQGPQIKNPDSEEEKSTTDIKDEIDKIVTKVNLRDSKHCLDAAEQVDVASAADVVENIKKRAKSEREERGKKKRKRATTVTDRIEGVLEQLPQFLATANSAAKAHTRALAKWEKKFCLASSSDSD